MKLTDIIESIESSYRLFGTFSSSRLFPLAGGNFLYSSGVPFAGENWAWISKNNEKPELLPLSLVKEAVESAVDTFQKLSIPFVLPMLPEIPEEASAFLDNIGLLVRGSFTAMFLDLEGKKLINRPLAPIRFEKSSPLLWSSICWRGFGADEPHETFDEFAKNAGRNRMIHMFTAFRENEPCGSALLAETNCAYVLFYFSVLPEKRRLGIGGAMMDRVIEFAEHKRFITLLATPAGKLLYERKGFRTAACINIRSFSDDIE